MYKNQRIIIDTRKYDVDEVFERYKHGQLFFYEKRSAARAHKNKVTREVLEALWKGIPFPPVYVSELQNGALLVLEKNNRLRFLMEYLEYGFDVNSKDTSELEETKHFLEKMEKYGSKKDIYYSAVMLHVIDYLNPKYMHMQVGAFIEEWTNLQEQSIRNILYHGEGMEFFGELLSKIDYPLRLELNIQYNLIYFLMVHCVASRFFNAREVQSADRFQLLEYTLYGLQDMDGRFLDGLCEQFESLYYFLGRKANSSSLFIRISAEDRTKYLCFMGIWEKIRTGENRMEVFENKRVRNMVERCDMSFMGINRIAEIFREGDLW